jgi:hypothetical protein
VENALKFAEEQERVRNIGNVREVLVDVFLEEGFNVRNINVELNEVSVELVVSVLKKLVILSLKFVDESLEDVQDGLDVLKVVFLKSFELLDSAEKLNKLCNSTLEKVEASENLSRGEIELLGLRHVLESLLSELVLADVGLVESKALLEDFNELFMGNVLVFPKDAVV